ncbi:MAG: zinc finger Ran-binding domain-containing protein [Methanomassiliicoccales archaeon]|nr:zinc finger Ran-binding domain-containing protein [Methanomassiliicoccales archaeon]
MAVILLASLGGLIAFFGLFFGIVGAVAEGGFIYVSLVACSLAIIMIAISYFSRRRQLHDWRQERQLDASLANCAYCGYHNEVGSRKCESCGAPLKLRR